MQQDPIDDPRSRSRLTIGEDWLATIVGLALVGLVLLGVLTRSMVP
jgi:hypothetical protein